MTTPTFLATLPILFTFLYPLIKPILESPMEESHGKVYKCVDWEYVLYMQKCSIKDWT